MPTRPLIILEYPMQVSNGLSCYLCMTWYQIHQDDFWWHPHSELYKWMKLKQWCYYIFIITNLFWVADEFSSNFELIPLGNSFYSSRNIDPNTLVNFLKKKNSFELNQCNVWLQHLLLKLASVKGHYVINPDNNSRLGKKPPKFKRIIVIDSRPGRKAFNRPCLLACLAW